MPRSFDFSIDPLASAALTIEQRRVWNAFRGEMASALAKNQELEEKLRAYEQQKIADEPAVLTRVDFNREVARMLAFDERYGGMSSILYFDVEGMNPTTADATLREVASVLVHGVRSSDIVGRLAPDEFGILLMRCDNASAWRKAESLSATLQDALARVGEGLSPTRISYGAYTFRDNEDLSVGLKEAAQLMMSTSR
ncbi:MAG: diguanylate cyclase [Alphaproteobacteria bacterium]|nr:diguanylate cyclase [Alphaproteobacteria bacterium]